MPYPSMRSPELEAEILRRLSAGEPLAQICRDEGMPSPNGFRDWTKADEALAIAYARAREDGFDVIAMNALDILDEEPERVTITSGEDRTETRIDGASVLRAKNRFEGRLKLLAKWDPKRYGDKLDVSHKGVVASAKVELPDDPNEAERKYRDLMSRIEDDA